MFGLVVVNNIVRKQIRSAFLRLSQPLSHVSSNSYVIGFKINHHFKKSFGIFARGRDFSFGD